MGNTADDTTLFRDDRTRGGLGRGVLDEAEGAAEDGFLDEIAVLVENANHLVDAGEF